MNPPAMDDRTLLRRYVLNRDQAAFSDLVRRHADLVYSAALRQVGDHHRAQEVTQSVFLALARKAGALADHPALAAWLFRSTRLSSAKLREADFRRRAREDRLARVAEADEAAAGPTGDEWARVSPCLDQALAALRERDRIAVVLRFFQQRGYAEVGLALGVGENAARMRTERALEKLRAVLSRRGVRSTAEALGVALGAHGVAAAPSGVPSAVLAGVTAAGAAAHGGFLSGLFFMTNLKTVALPLVVAGLAGLATYQLMRSDEPEKAASPSVPAAAPIIAAEPAREAGTAALRAENAELRDRLAKAEADLETRAKELEKAARRLADLRRPMMPHKLDAVSSRLRAETKPGEVIVTGGSLTKDGKRLFAFVTPENLGPTQKGPHQLDYKSKLVALPEEAVAELGLDHLVSGAAHTLQHGEVWAPSEVERVLSRLSSMKGTDVLSAPRVTVLSGTEATVSIGEANQDGEFVGVSVGLLPEAPAADGTLNTEVSVELAEEPAR